MSIVNDAKYKKIDDAFADAFTGGFNDDSSEEMQRAPQFSLFTNNTKNLEKQARELSQTNEKLQLENRWLLMKLKIQKDTTKRIEDRYFKAREITIKNGQDASLKTINAKKIIWLNIILLAFQTFSIFTLIVMVFLITTNTI